MTAFAVLRHEPLFVLVLAVPVSSAGTSAQREVELATGSGESAGLCARAAVFGGDGADSGNASFTSTLGDGFTAGPRDGPNELPYAFQAGANELPYAFQAGANELAYAFQAGAGEFPGTFQDWSNEFPGAFQTGANELPGAFQDWSKELPKNFSNAFEDGSKDLSKRFSNPFRQGSSKHSSEQNPQAADYRSKKLFHFMSP